MLSFRHPVFASGEHRAVLAEALMLDHMMNPVMGVAVVDPRDGELPLRAAMHIPGGHAAAVPLFYHHLGAMMTKMDWLCLVTDAVSAGAAPAEALARAHAGMMAFGARILAMAAEHRDSTADEDATPDEDDADFFPEAG